MIAVRPYQFFALLEGSPAERIAAVPIPSRRSGGGLKLLETFIVVAACKISGARRVFEFGTYHGATTYSIALNTPDSAEILTLDLDAIPGAGSMHPADVPLAAEHLDAAALDFEGTPVAHKIARLKGNSRTFSCAPWSASIDLVFIDGGHDLETVAADTKNAMSMARRDKQSCILWHDYANTEYPEITVYLNDLAAETPVLHIEETMLCAWFSQPVSI